MRIRSLPLLLGLCVFSAYGSISVIVQRMAKLFAQPTENSPILTEVAGKSPFRALEQSQDKEWVFVSDGLRYGWIRKNFVRMYEEPLAAASEQPFVTTTRERVVSKDFKFRKNKADSDLPLDDEILEDGGSKKFSDNFSDEFESGVEGDVFVVRTTGSLYEKPLRNAKRFGKIESNDQVEFLTLSNDQRWARVRVLETGEEGWLPRKNIARKVGSTELENLNRPSDRNLHLGAYGIFAPTPWSLGFVGTFSKTYESLVIAEIPLELGVGFGYNVGATYSQSLTVSYLDMRAYARWEPRLRPKVALPVNVGLLYKYGVIRTTLTQSEFKAIGSRVRQGETGLSFGIGVSYLPNDVFKFTVLPEVQVTTSIDLVLDAGISFSF